MIKLELDEAFCFDFLSIVEVKCHKAPSPRMTDNFFHVRNKIMQQVGEKKTFSILGSIEYELLYQCNAKIFDLVNEIKRNPGLLASVIDDQNYRRFELKKALQEKFFPEKPLIEMKFGYQEGKE